MADRGLAKFLTENREIRESQEHEDARLKHNFLFYKLQKNKAKAKLVTCTINNYKNQMVELLAKKEQGEQKLQTINNGNAQIRVQIRDCKQGM